jgi:hypothetical protein
MLNEYFCNNETDKVVDGKLLEGKNIKDEGSRQIEQPFVLLDLNHKSNDILWLVSFMTNKMLVDE